MITLIPEMSFDTHDSGKGKAHILGENEKAIVIIRTFGQGKFPNPDAPMGEIKVTIDLKTKSVVSVESFEP